MSISRYNHACTYLRNNTGHVTTIIVVGGHMGNNSHFSSATVEFYDVMSQTWKYGPNLPTPVEDGALAQANHSPLYSAYLFGGRSTADGACTTAVYALSNMLDSWEKIGDLKTKRCCHIGIRLPNTLLKQHT